MKVIIIGAGFGGLSAAAYLAKAGHEVTILEKSTRAGGRADTFEQDGFRFELGPSWYLMPDIFEEFFSDFGHKPSDFYQLERLTPSYRVYGEKDVFNARPRPAASMEFEHFEPEAGPKVARFFDETKQEYELARRKILPLSGLSKSAFLKATARHTMSKPGPLGPYHARVAKVVQNEFLQHVLEFMTMFLGGSPQNIPALYAMLAHVDFGQGVWYPQDGFNAVAQAVLQVAKEQGAEIIFDSPVQEIVVENGKVTGVRVNGKIQEADVVISNADYYFTDSALTPKPYQIYDAESWHKKTHSPAVVLANIGVKKRLNLAHHNLFFDTDWNENIADIFDHHQLNEHPLFYANVPSKSDKNVAPKNSESLTLLIPMGNKIKLQQREAERLVQDAVHRIEVKTKQKLQNDIVVRNVLTPQYFEEKFGALGGNAFGLSHTLKQTGPLRPPIRSPKLENLFFVGQSTHPGTGVPLVILGGKNVARTVAQNTFDR